MGGNLTYDPRDLIRETIGEQKALNPDSWDEQWCLTITENDIEYNIPIYLLEESKSKDLPPLPLIDISIVEVDYEPHDIGALTRKCEAYLDVGVYYTCSDEINPQSFGKAILDELMSRVRDEQENCNFGNSAFISVRSIRQRKEEIGRQVVYQFIVEIYCLYYD